jgi:hypothetical protein
MFPSGPSVAARPTVGDGSWTTSELEIAPLVAIRPMEDPPTWLPLSTNQIFPSGPVVIPQGVVSTGIGYSVIVPAAAPADAELAAAITTERTELA